jgi:hypothetical protein
MRRTTRQVIAVMVVATALCADRAVASAPHARVQPSRSFASRLATSLRQTVPPSVRLQPVRTLESVRSFPLPIGEAASGVRSELSPFQFRLPPPTNR